MMKLTNLSQAFIKAIGVLAPLALLPAMVSYGLTLPLPPAGENVVGDIYTVKSRSEDTLNRLGRRYDIGYLEMIAANPKLDPYLPSARTEVVVPSRFILPPGPRTGIVINLAELRLYYYPPGSGVVMTYPIGIGHEGKQTPTGNSYIVRKRENPTWVVPKEIAAAAAANGNILPSVVPPGPDNPLGDYAMNLSFDTYLIHGTNNPPGVGLRSSSGCIRMLPQDVAELFHIVNVGTPVRIINEPYKVGWNGSELYLEAHEALTEQKGSYTETLDNMVNKLENLAGNGSQIFWDKARRVGIDKDGIPHVVGIKAVHSASN